MQKSVKTDTFAASAARNFAPRHALLRWIALKLSIKSTM
jgi:hypothetical protein